MARQRQRRSITQLRHAIDSLPLETRQAMLAGVRASDIIVGAYTDRDGGVCPMLAAHRHGPRGDFLGFARAWDRYTGAGRRARRASEREVRILTMQLEESIAAEQQLPDLAAAVADHRALTAGRERHFAPARESRERPGDPDRRRELRHRPGWSWLRPVRRLEDFEAMLADAGAAEDRAAEREPELV
jgi:hypothetical protein